MKNEHSTRREGNTKRGGGDQPAQPSKHQLGNLGPDTTDHLAGPQRNLIASEGAGTQSLGLPGPWRICGQGSILCLCLKERQAMYGTFPLRGSAGQVETPPLLSFFSWSRDHHPHFTGRSWCSERVSSHNNRQVALFTYLVKVLFIYISNT